MSRRKKPKSILGMIMYMIFAPIYIILKEMANYKPYNSTGRKISRAKKKKWF